MVKLPHIAVILLFGMIVMSSGCHTPTQSGPAAPKRIPSLSDTGLSGSSWRWISTEGWSVGGIVKPGYPGYNYSLTLQFTDDSVFNFLRADTMVEKAVYHILPDTLADPFYHLISFKNIKYHGYGYLNDAWIAMHGDTLIVALNVTDGNTDNYLLIQ
jgi:hypothetical protein